MYSQGNRLSLCASLAGNIEGGKGSRDLPIVYPRQDLSSCDKSMRGDIASDVLRTTLLVVR